MALHAKLRNVRPVPKLRTRMNLQSYTFPIRDKDRAAAAGKPQDKTKKPTGEKRDRTTTNIDEAAIIAIAPKEFKTSSILLWQAQKVAENLWNWPKIDYRLGGSLHKMQDNACRLCYICQV